MRRKVLVVAALAALAAFAASATLIAGAGASSSKVLNATLKGRNEVPLRGDPNGSGSARLTLNAGLGKVCYSLTWTKIGTAVAAHIHKGRAGVSGPVVVPLFGAAPGRHSGCIKHVKASLIRSIEGNPKGFYVNIHTRRYAGGAVRGQLHT